MADNYLGRKMEEYFARPAEKPHRHTPALGRLLLRTRSYRGYDPAFRVREDQLRRIISVNTLTPSACNRQELRFRMVLDDEADKILPHITLGARLAPLHLPLPGTEPRAFIVICATCAEDRYTDIDLGISAQSMLLQATEIGLNGICIAVFDRKAVRSELGLDLEPLLILAIGKGAEKIELRPIRAGEKQDYYRQDGTHYVPKIVAEDLILPAAHNK